MVAVTTIKRILPIPRVKSWATQWMSRLEQELLTSPEHLTSLPVFDGNHRAHLLFPIDYSFLFFGKCLSFYIYKFVYHVLISSVFLSHDFGFHVKFMSCIYQCMKHARKNQYILFLIISFEGRWSDRCQWRKSETQNRRAQMMYILYTEC